MTEKVKVTREQAEAIERIKTEQIKRFEEVKKNKTAYLLTDWEKPLFEMDSKHLQDALYIGYEVEPEFKENDWVVYKLANDERIIGKIIEVKEDFALVEFSEYPTPQYILLSELNHATPEEIAEEKERRWWKKHGREPWELKLEDVLVDTDGEIQEVTSANVKTNGTVQYCIDYCAYSLEHIKERFIIMVFKENRLDVKTDD